MASQRTSSAASSHTIDDKALGEYIARSGNISGLSLPLVTTKIGYGQSNPTYFVDDARGNRFVLRKKPTGKTISPVAHQVDREFKVLKALSTVEGFPVPKVYTLCMDRSVIGTEFYVMEFVKGRIIKDVDMEELSLAEKRQAWFSAIETLAWLHSLDPDAIGLEGYGKKHDFYARHCAMWSRIEAQQAAVRDAKTGKALGRAHEKFDETMAYVNANLPMERSAIVHGDFKFDNMVLHPTEPKIIAILDWELSTIGHPLMDLIFLTSPFFNDYTKIVKGGASSQASPYKPHNRHIYGMPEPNELLDRYAEIVGFDLRKDGGGRDWEVGAIFHFIRSGTISHGIQARTMTGQASSEFSHLYFGKTKASMEAAYRRMEKLRKETSAASL